MENGVVWKLPGVTKLKIKILDDLIWAYYQMGKNLPIYTDNGLVIGQDKWGWELGRGAKEGGNGASVIISTITITFKRGEIKFIERHKRRHENK